MAGGTGVTPLDKLIQDVWPDELSDATQSEVVLSNLVDTHYKSAMSHGDLIHIPNRSNPAVRVKTEDSAATLANMVETEQTVTVNRQAYVYFEVEDIAALQASWDARSEYTDAGGYSLVAYLEGDVTSGVGSLGSGFTNLFGVYGSDPTDDDWLKCVQTLDSGDVPRKGRFIWASPSTNISLLKNAKFYRQETVGQGSAETAIKEASVGRIYGADVYVSTLAENNPSSSGTSLSWFCHQRGVALIEQRRPMVHQDFIIADISMAVLIDMIYQFASRLITPSLLGGGSATDRFNCALKGS